MKPINREQLAMVRRLLAGSLYSLLAMLVVLATLSLSVLAATISSTGGSGNGLKISPVTTNLTISPGQSQAVTVYVQNITDAPVTLSVVVNDFTSNDESGTPALLLNNDYAPTHSLKRFVAPISDLTLKAGQEQSVSVVITIPKGTPGGGYYGAVRFVPMASGGGNSVTLWASVGSLILVKVPGNITESLQLVGLDVRHWQVVNNQYQLSGPQLIFTSGKMSGRDLVAAARFQNSGNVQEQPFGKVELRKGSTVLGSYEINNTDPRGNVLPASIRLFTVDLDKVGSFGKYTIIGDFGYGSNGQLLSGTTSFYVIPWPLILIVVLMLLLIPFFIIVFPKLVRRYNQRVIRRARQGMT